MSEHTNLTPSVSSRRRYRWSIALLLLCAALMTACNSAPPSTQHWTTAQALEAFRSAGLSVDQIHTPDDGEGLPSSDGTDAVIFRIAHADGEATGYIFSLPSSAAAEQLRQSDASSQLPPTNGFSRLAFRHDNLFVMLFGRAPEATLRQYEEALKMLK